MIWLNDFHRRLNGLSVELLAVDLLPLELFTCSFTGGNNSSNSSHLMIRSFVIITLYFLSVVLIGSRVSYL